MTISPHIDSFKSFWTKETNVFWFGFIIAFVATLLETARGGYANFLVFSDSTIDFWKGINPYTMDFVAEHKRYFLYTPVFSVLFAPFAFLPRFIGPFLWNLMNYTLFFLSVKTLPRPYAGHQLKMFLYLLPILEQSIFPFQYNIVVAYIFLFSFTLMERGRFFWAIFLIMLSATTKIYGIFGLAMLFCYRDTLKHFAYAILCGAAFLVLPALKVGFEGLMLCYQNWINMLDIHQTDQTWDSIFYIQPFAQWLLPNFRILQMSTLALLAIVFFCMYRKWSNFTFRARVTGVIMGWIILFSDSAETHTYLIALSGFMLCYYTMDQPSTFDKILYWANLFFLGIAPIDLFVPRSLKLIINYTLWLHVYTYTITWIRMIVITLSKKSTPVLPESEGADKYSKTL